MTLAIILLLIVTRIRGRRLEPARLLTADLILGTIRGFTVRLYQRDGVPWYRYGPVTVALWLLSILIRIALAAVASARDASPLIAGGDLLFMLGLARLCQNLVVIRRHSHPQARPSHPVEPVDAGLSRTCGQRRLIEVLTPRTPTRETPGQRVTKSGSP